MEESGIKAASQHTRRLLRSSSKNSRPLYHLRQLNTTFFVVVLVVVVTFFDRSFVSCKATLILAIKNRISVPNFVKIGQTVMEISRSL